MSALRPLKKLTVVDQALAHLRTGIESGHWTGVLPGTPTLASELDVSVETIHKAFKILEKEGLVLFRGSGKRREVAPGARAPGKKGAPGERPMRIGVLTHEDPGVEAMSSQILAAKIINAIEAAGHSAFIAEKSMQALKLDSARIRKMTSGTGADAWIAVSAPREILRTLATGPVPAFAVGGVPEDAYPIASTGVPLAPCMRDCTRHLTSLGHRRIVLACPAYWRTPEPTASVRYFREELIAVGVKPGAYNLPEWEHGAEGFRALLTSLFSVTPPTAMIVEDARQAVAVQAFLASRGRRIPRDLSLVTVRSDASLDWTFPRFARFDRNEDRIVVHVMRWLNDCAKGRTVRPEKIAVPATFDPGETVGPVPAS